MSGIKRADVVRIVALHAPCGKRSFKGSFKSPGVPLSCIVFPLSLKILV